MMYRCSLSISSMKAVSIVRSRKATFSLRDTVDDDEAGAAVVEAAALGELCHCLGWAAPRCESCYSQIADRRPARIPRPKRRAPQ